MYNKGFTPIMLVIIVALVVAGISSYIVLKQRTTAPNISQPQVQESVVATTAPSLPTKAGTIHYCGGDLIHASCPDTYACVHNPNARSSAELGICVSQQDANRTAPHIDSILPRSGPVGTIVTITGSGFNTSMYNHIIFYPDMDSLAVTQDYENSPNGHTLKFTIPDQILKPVALCGECTQQPPQPSPYNVVNGSYTIAVESLQSLEGPTYQKSNAFEFAVTQ